VNTPEFNIPAGTTLGATTPIPSSGEFWGPFLHPFGGPMFGAPIFLWREGPHALFLILPGEMCSVGTRREKCLSADNTSISGAKVGAPLFGAPKTFGSLPRRYPAGDDLLHTKGVFAETSDPLQSTDREAHQRHARV